MKTSRQHPPRFFWQGVLILLPVVALAAAGLVSLWQDKALAQHEAREKAQAHADDIAGVLWSRLTDRAALDEFKDHTFRLDARGQLVFPPPAAGLPAPRPFDSSNLDDRQLKLWAIVNAPPSAARSNAMAACRELLELNPPEAVAAATQHRLALLLEAAGRPLEAAVALRAMLDKFPDAVSEAGLPLAPLARFKLLQLNAASDQSKTIGIAALDSFCSNVVHQPTFLTPHLLARAGELEVSSGPTDIVERWRGEWSRQESLRDLAGAALVQAPSVTALTSSSPAQIAATNAPPVPVLFWFHAQDLSETPQPVYPTAQLVLPNRASRSRSGLISRNRIAGFAGAGGDPTNTVSAGNTTAIYPPQDVQRSWLATRFDDGAAGCWIACRVIGSYSPNHTSVDSAAWTELLAGLPALPLWFGYSLDVAGRTSISGKNLETISFETGGKGSGQRWAKGRMSSTPEVMATARRYENGAELLTVNIHLVSPQMLYYRQRARSYLFSVLIGASVVAALVGFVSARRAFLREQTLSEMKSNFVSSVSHELRAPIASVRLLAESLERGKIAEPAKQNEYFRFIVQECRRLSSLIENVLDFARIEQGRKQYEFEPADIAALVRQTAKLMEPAAAEKQISLTTNLDGSQLTCDAPALQQALINLLDNAIKHSPTGETVNVGLCSSRLQSAAPLDGAPVSDPVRVNQASQLAGSETGAPSSIIEISVTDQGPGIPPEEHERIFERFYRRGSEMRRETQGVGIGLSIVKHIVEAHGGRVRVESQVGKGSRFVIELPLSGKQDSSR